MHDTRYPPNQPNRPDTTRTPRRMFPLDRTNPPRPDIPYRQRLMCPSDRWRLPHHTSLMDHKDRWTYGTPFPPIRVYHLGKPWTHRHTFPADRTIPPRRDTRFHWLRVHPRGTPSQRRRRFPPDRNHRLTSDIQNRSLASDVNKYRIDKCHPYSPIRRRCRRFHQSRKHPPGRSSRLRRRSLADRTRPSTPGKVCRPRRRCNYIVRPQPYPPCMHSRRRNCW